MRAMGIMAVVAWTALSASAMTLRTKADLRLWQTVMDRSAPLSWAWEDGADAATLTFSNRLKRVVTSVRVVRAPDAWHGSCAQPISLTAEEGLFSVTLVQTAACAEIARATAELAYVPGAAPCAVSPPITVWSTSDRAWWRVDRSRLSAFDANWWNRGGPSGYETIVSEGDGWQRVSRTFEDQTVDWVQLLFLYPGTILFVR